ncbi:MAG TPA: hypothetical protein VLV54_17440 [Thermoanaerobaculia bacterium]|nr:hypothetical protein [Thermoanaerobaculia bacterium]
MPKRTRFALNPRLLIALKLLVVLAVLCVTLAPAPSQAATTRCGTEIYYWDSTFTDNVGLRAWLAIECGCGAYGWGVITPYRTFDNAVC